MEGQMKRLEWIFHIIAFAFQCGAIVSVFLRTGDSAESGFGHREKPLECWKSSAA